MGKVEEFVQRTLLLLLVAQVKPNSAIEVQIHSDCQSTRLLSLSPCRKHDEVMSNLLLAHTTRASRRSGEGGMNKLTSRANGNRCTSKSVDFWYFLISLRATVPGL